MKPETHEFLRFPVGHFKDPKYDNGRCWQVTPHKTYCGQAPEYRCHVTTERTGNTDEHAELGWFSDWPTVNGFYWLRGWRHYGDLPINIDGDSFWMMFNLTKSHRTDLDDSEDVQFLGPITPYSDVTAATRMRDKCVERIQVLSSSWEHAAIAWHEKAESESRPNFKRINYEERDACLHKRDAANVIKNNLESLTLEPVNKGGLNEGQI